MEHDPMPTGILAGPSYIEKMSDDEFYKMCEVVLINAMKDAPDASKLGPVTHETAEKVRRIVKASGFHFSQTAHHVSTAASIAATSFVMLGEKPTPEYVRSVIYP
ncbi:hypothetical protein [Sinorhizobium mexicanum]|uniref:Uncharacterized protein n=1 Tax=Sinorhizobium mexicanum TaxID=375549 RepID=A0A859QFE8_9HYPH|nr:hypothetical protein [Sinorhizobium mexicanum]MBP1887674.1 hypothetical protein [Sinorhizobium mexicanum]QLL62264.1 hypothetical protein FKV68_12850 [Sinorhizobium mexicanum]